jgi:hypothetical protein
MKVYTLDIDSGDRDPIIYPDSGDYVIHLKTPVYNVKNISLVSARIPNSQTLINQYNNTFTIGSTDISLPNGQYTLAELADAIDSKSTSITSVVKDTSNNTISFSFSGASSFGFNTGIHGFSSSNTHTTPHDILGLPSDDILTDNNTIHSGYVNLNGPDSIILKLSSGSSEFNKTVHSKNPYYTGVIMTNGLYGETTAYSGSEDPIDHEFHTAPENTISNLRIQLFTKSNNRLIPYDTRNANHVLKFKMTCSTDKLENVPREKIPEDEEEKEEEEEEEEPKSKVERYSIHATEDKPEDVDKWNAIMSIVFIILIGFVLLMIPKRKPSP